MAELEKLSDYARCPGRATPSNRFNVSLPDALVVNMTPEQMQVTATLRMAEATEHIAMAQARQLELLTFGGPWIPVEHRLPEQRPGQDESSAVIASEYTGSQVYAVYNHAAGKWQGLGLDYEPRITHWLPAPAGPGRQEGGQPQ